MLALQRLGRKTRPNRRSLRTDGRIVSQIFEAGRSNQSGTTRPKAGSGNAPRPCYDVYDVAWCVTRIDPKVHVTFLEVT